VATVADRWWTLVLELLLLGGWIAWWLCAVNWVKAWDWLARGAWVAVLLLVFLGALVWSRIEVDEFDLGFTRVPNFWWQFVGTALLACLALFCGWLQGILGWMPADIPIYPPEEPHAEDHGHGGHH
jgi:hypothetical protein